MRFRFGVVIGFAVGYYLGAKAGRTRYLQLREWLDKAKPVVVDLAVNGGSYSPSR